MSNTDGTLPQDIAFDILSSARRRFVLRSLQESTDGVDLGDLAAELAAMENGVSKEELTSKQRKRAYVSLYQTHIPKMEKAGVIKYDKDAGIVYPTDTVQELSSYFREPTTTPPWYLVYGSAAAIGLVAYVVVAVLNDPVVGPFHIGVGFVLVIALVSAIHYVYLVRANSDSVIPIEGD